MTGDWWLEELDLDRESDEDMVLLANNELQARGHKERVVAVRDAGDNLDWWVVVG